MSIVVGTLHADDSAVARRLRALAEMAADVGAELVVAGRTPVPAGVADLTTVRWIQSPGTPGMFELRRQAVAMAAGEVVVLFEDHCQAEAAWLPAVLAAFQTTSADMVVSPVRNLTTRTTIDRAAFAVSLGPFMIPLDTRVASSQVAVAGGAIARTVARRLAAACSAGSIELASPGEVAALDLRVVPLPEAGVGHHQHGTWWTHACLHFHNARAITGRRTGDRRRTWLRLALTPLLLPLRVARTLGRRQRAGDTTVELCRLAPALVWLYGAKAIGEWLGAMTGPGRSDHYLE